MCFQRDDVTSKKCETKKENLFPSSRFSIYRNFIKTEVVCSSVNTAVNAKG
jgi:hypothetical protein